MADDSFRKAREEFEKMQDSAAKMLKTQQDIEKSLSGWANAIKDIHKTEKDILLIKEQKAKAEKDLADYEKSIERKRKLALKNLNSANKKNAERSAEILANLEAEVNLRKANVILLDKEVKKQEQSVENLKKAVSESNKLKSIANSSVNFAKKWGWDNLKKYGVFELDKEIRNAARSMGVGNKEFSKFSDNLITAGRTTNMIGVSTKQLAKLQQGYSEEIGRSVRLSESGLVAIAEMAEGTGLGEQFAISMAGAMDNLGGSVQTSNKLIEDTMNMADSMGVNSAKAAKSLQQNLKLAQKYNFKGGVKGLAQMTTEALKLKLDIEGIAGLVDKVFRPEGAVEMAAKLQTMGGAFAQMADPMRLMFKARNDFKGFAKDIGKATAEFVKYNSETGTFDLQGGLAADRMREIANMTGIGVEKLQEMATAQKRIQMIGSVVPVGVDDETIGIIESISEIGKNGEITITKGDFNGKLLKDLTKQQLSTLKEEQKTLEERAKQSRTAEEQLNDILNTFKDLLIPIAQGLKEGIGDPLKEMLKDWNRNGFYDKLFSFTKAAGGLITSIGEFIFKNPIKTFVAAIAGWSALKAATWFANGVTLGLGFNSVANASGGSNGSFTNKFNSRGTMKGRGGMTSRDRYARRFGDKAANRNFGNFGKYGKFSKLGKIAKIGGGGLAVASAGFDAFNNFTDEELSGMDAFLKTLDQNKFTAIGAALAPFTGGLSLAAGGALDAITPTFGDYGPKGTKSDVEDGIIKFHPRDKFMVTNDALVASTSQNQLNTLSDKISNGIAEVKHKFDDIKVTININATGIDNEIGKHLIDDKKFIRLLKTRINEEASMVLSGGILSGKPK